MKVLIVDDGAIGRESLKELLSSCNYDVQTAANASQAIDTANSFRPDIVIIDWMLGHQMDGLDTAAALEAMLPSVKIVIVSGHSRVTLTASKNVPYDFLMKPFRLADLLALLEDVEENA